MIQVRTRLPSSISRSRPWDANAKRQSQFRPRLGGSAPAASARRRCRPGYRPPGGRNKLKATPRRFLDSDLTRTVVAFRLREIPSDTSEQLPRSLNDLSLVVLLQVPLLQDAQRVLGQLRIGLTGHDFDGP